MRKRQRWFTQHYNNAKNAHSRVNSLSRKTNRQTPQTLIHSAGFTLIEILLVIGIIAVLATVVIVALDPVTRFNDARNSRRLSDMQSILSAVQQYIVDNKGDLPSGLDTTEKQLGTGVSGCDMAYGICSVNVSYCLDLSTSLARYLKALPYDPATGSSERTHYSIQINENNIVTIRACDSTDETISSVSQ